MRIPATRSGKAELVALDEVDAREAVYGDVMLTPAPTGYWPLEVRGWRESAYGESNETPQPCVVVDVVVLPSGGALVFAPEDLLTVRVRR
jgi:hypothetical protein